MPDQVLPRPQPEALDQLLRAQGQALHSRDQPPRDRADWRLRRERLVRAMNAAMGPVPERPAPLNARVFGVLRRRGYRIERLVFQSWPDVWVTANAYVPDPAHGRRPAVLAVHGHWAGARRDPVVQARCLGLVKLGFFVLAVDAFGAGERYTAPARGTYHGALYGSTLWPSGHTLLGMQVYDNRRAVDYLRSRPEVDGERLGITGASGGGNQSMYAGALDDRLRAVVPVCSVGTYQAYLRAACCVCEVLPGALRFAEEGDVLALTAPRALLVISATRDAFQFSVGEATRSIARARPVFKLLDALTGCPITELARQHDVSRKFVYQQADQAQQALAEAFTPEPPTDDAVLFYLPVTEAWLKRLILALLLICHSSYRGVYELLRDLFHCPRSLGYLHGVARTALDRARARNGQYELSGVDIGAHDELFQTGQPVLVGVDVASTQGYLLSLEEQRDGVTWGVRLLELQARGFAPQAIIGDAGSGLAAGQELALPDVPRRGDVFHVVRELGVLVRALEDRAYQALAACAKWERPQAQSERRQGRRDGSVGQKLRYARPAAAAAVALADAVATLVGWLRHDILALAGPCHAARRALYDFVVAELRARVPGCPHRLGPVCTYLANQRDAVLAFAEQLDADLEAVAEDFQVPVGVARAVLRVQEMAVRDRRRWPEEAALRQQLRGRFYELSAAVAAVARGTVRASSVVENLNSRLRNYFFLRRHLGPDYLHLLQFFLNHRRFLRSEQAERVDRSPAELLTGQRHAHWLELLGLPDPLAN